MTRSVCACERPPCGSSPDSGSSTLRLSGDTSLDCTLDAARLVALLENRELLPDAVVLAPRESPHSSPVSAPSSPVPVAVSVPSSLADSSSSESSLSISRCVCSSLCCSSARLRTRRSELAPPDRSTEPCRRWLCCCDVVPSPLSERVMARSMVRMRGEAEGVPLRLLGADWKTSLASEAEEPAGVARRDVPAEGEAWPYFSRIGLEGEYS